MYDRLSEVKRQHENKKKEDFFGVTLHPRDIDWLIEQAEKVRRYEEALKEIEDPNAFDDIQDEVVTKRFIAKQALENGVLFNSLNSK